MMQAHKEELLPCSVGAEVVGAFDIDRRSGATHESWAMRIMDTPRLVPNTTLDYVLTLSSPMGDITLDHLFGGAGDLSLAEGAVLTVIVADAYGQNQTRLAATLVYGNIVQTVTGAQRLANVRIRLGSAIPANRKMVYLMAGDVGVAGIQLLPNTAEQVLDNTTLLPVANNIFVRSEQLPTPGQWADGSTRTITRYDANNVVIGSPITATFVSIVNSPDGVAGRMQFTSANADFTVNNLNTAAKVIIT